MALKPQESTRPISRAEIPHLSELPARVNLRQLFPQSIGLIFVEAWAAIFSLVLLCAGYLVIGLSISDETRASGLWTAMTYLYYIGVVICLCKIIYEALCFYYYEYGIELEHLTIVRGLFFRNRTSIPLAKVNDVSLKRSPLQIIFGVYSFTILTASAIEIYGSIDGLSSKSAFGLQAYILALTETTLPDVKINAASAALATASDQLGVVPPLTPAPGPVANADIRVEPPPNTAKAAE